MISEIRPRWSPAWLAVAFSIAAVLFVVSGATTECARAANGSCAVGDTEVFAAGVTINEDGADADTRIEGDTNSNLVFIDASTDRIGVNTITPSTLLEVAGGVSTFSTVDINGGDITGITDITVADGGTGVSSLADHGVILGSGTSAVSVTGTGTSGQVLTSNGSSADPTFQDSGAGLQIATGSYTGDGSTAQAITGLGFQPVFLWISNRETSDLTADRMYYTTDVINDDIGGGGAWMNDGTVNSHRFQSSAVVSLDSDGFTVDDRASDDHPNQTSFTYNYWAIGS